MIDSHCHINDDAFLENCANYIKEAGFAGVFKFLIVGCDLKSSRIAVEIAEKYENCYAAVGIHPNDYKNAGINDLDEIENLAMSKKVVAIGEIGLDYYWDKDENVKKQQKDAFIKQINLANKLNLPISIHCRDAYEDCYRILKENPVKKLGVLHCYSGSKEMAIEFQKLGYYFGFGGTVTFKNSIRPKEVATIIDKDHYLLETDAPYLAPHPYRGNQNHSKYLYLVRDELAHLRNVSADEIDKETDSNFERLFLHAKN